jgi:hypothetical protein
VFFVPLPNVSSRGGTSLSRPNTCRIDLPLFQSLTPRLLAAALLPMKGQGPHLSAFSSSTILIIGSGRDKHHFIPVARTYTTQFCREIVHRLQVCHSDKAIDVSVVYKSELYDKARRRQVQIPERRGGKTLDNTTMDEWFLTNERTTRGYVTSSSHVLMIELQGGLPPQLQFSSLYQKIILPTILTRTILQDVLSSSRSTMFHGS